ncbi:MAG: superoxide dismutase [Rikenellaceae bacterium]|nr:superoxide dismutase [Rikenellaceae bacterium]
MKKFRDFIIGGSFWVLISGFTLPELPYGPDALSPVMSRETIKYHHGKHVQSYVDKLNDLIIGTPFENSTLTEIVKSATGNIFNNGAQIVNHILFFDGLGPESETKDHPEGELYTAIIRDFGSFEDFKNKFEESGNSLFGSGWVWLVSDNTGNLEILKTGNADNPIREGKIPLIAVDLWEHSYYIDYRNQRNTYLGNIWRITDWDMVEERYSQR